MRDFYFDGEPIIEPDMFNNVNRLAQDNMFVYGIFLSALIQSTKSSGRTFLARLKTIITGF